MSVRGCLILALAVIGSQIIAAAQDPAPQNPPVQGSSDNGARQAPARALSAIAGMQPEGGAEEGSANDVPPIPALLGGAGISSAFLSELERSNYLRAGVNVGAAYDDNPVLLSGGAQSNTSVSIFPNFSIEESTSRTRWKLAYAGGLTINENLPNQNQQAQNVNFDSQFRLSPHVNLRAAEQFSYTTGFFDSGNGSGVIGSGGPNSSLIVPLSTQRSSTSTVETNYHFALNDLVGASGSFYDLHFTDVPAGTQLTNSQTATGSAFWLHRIFRGDWVGASYHFDRITFDPSGESRVHSFYIVDTMSASNHLTFTGFIGPQYSENQGVTPGGSQFTQSKAWSMAGGAEGGWQDQRTSLSAGYSRSITDGGGVLGAVRLQNVHASFRRELVPGWAAVFTVLHGSNESIVSAATGSASSINLTSAGVSLERNVRKSFGLRLGYTHDFQQQYGLPAPDPTLDAHRNRFFVTLSYQWAKPLGM
jgi:hypothetical protein